MATKDDRQALQRRFSGLTSAERRAIVKAVNRGRAIETRKHAPLAVHIAHRQMRFWKWSWVIGPAVGLLQIGQLGPAAAVLNALLATALLGSMSAFFYLRAQRSAQANLALMGGKRPGPSFDQPEAKRRFWQRGKRGRSEDASSAGSVGSIAGSGGSRSHLPRRPGAADTSGSEDGRDGSGPSSGPRAQPDLPPERRPYQPRGKKRRGR